VIVVSGDHFSPDSYQAQVDIITGTVATDVSTMGITGRQLEKTFHPSIMLSIITDQL